MKTATRIILGGLAIVAALGLAACSGSERIRVYVEPTYEQDRLQHLLAVHPQVQVLIHSGSEDVTLRVEAVREPPGPRRIPRAALRARERRSGYEAYAVAEFLRVRNTRGGRARWASSYEDGVREDDLADILFEVVREAAQHQHPGHKHSLAELAARLNTTAPAE